MSRAARPCRDFSSIREQAAASESSWPICLTCGWTWAEHLAPDSEALRAALLQALADSNPDMFAIPKLAGEANAHLRRWEPNAFAHKVAKRAARAALSLEAKDD
jgi:hypothetical protein